MNEDLLTKAKQAESPEALVLLAKENGIELTDEKAAELFSQFHQCGELSENELSNVSGGGCVHDVPPTHVVEPTGAVPKCPVCGHDKDIGIRIKTTVVWVCSNKNCPNYFK